MVMEAAKRRGLQDKQPQPGAVLGPPGSQPTGIHHHSLSGQMPSHVGQPSHSLGPHTNNGRPSLDRAHTFPTPPTSASSIMGNQSNSYEQWGQNMSGSVQSSQPLGIDTGLSNARSLPTTPASTPPGNTLHSMQSYQNTQPYDSSRPAMYSAAPQQQSQYATQQQNLARFGPPMQPNPYMKNDMGPPSRAAGQGAEGDQGDIKQETYAHGQGNDQMGHGAGEDEAEHEHDTDYAHDNNAAYHANRGSYNYTTGSTMGSLHGENPHLSPEQVNGSPHQNGSGRITPRTAASQQSQWGPGYNTPPRTGKLEILHDIVGDIRSKVVNSHSSSDSYAASSGYPPAAVNGTGVSNKRQREDDDSEYKGRPASGGEEIDSLKRLRRDREGSMGTAFDSQGRPMSHSRSTIIRSARR